MFFCTVCKSPPGTSFAPLARDFFHCRFRVALPRCESNSRVLRLHSAMRFSRVFVFWESFYFRVLLDCVP
jgi:hypothetical protein